MVDKNKKYFESVFIDFDNTLFDTYRFVADAKEVSKQFDIDEKIFNQALHTAVYGRLGNYYDYTFEFHLELMKEMGAIFLAEELLRKFQYLLKNNKYEFEDALKLVEFLRENSNQIYLLTAGNKNFQKMKLATTDLGDYFHDILICHSGKEDLIGSVGTLSEKSLSINDNLRENKSIKEKYPEMMVITKFNDKKYQEQEAGSIQIPYFKTLKEIQNYAQEQIK